MSRVQRYVARIVTFVLVLCCVFVPRWIQASSSDTFMRIYQLDAGRKYFTLEQLKGIVDMLAENNYTHFELIIANDGCRFFLDDMSLETASASYSSDAVKEAIHAGNTSYHQVENERDKQELTQSDVEELVSYALSKDIELIPLVNTPGHMHALLYAMEYLGIEHPYFGSTKSTVSFENSEALNFTYALMNKYAHFFASLGCNYFHLGADEYAVHEGGFYALIESGGYRAFIDHLNTLASLVKSYGMTAMAFNDGIYYANTKPEGSAIDTDIVITYWNEGSDTNPLRSAQNLAADGFSLITANRKWYYVLGKRTGANGSYDICMQSVKSIGCTQVRGAADMDVMGCMLCLWCDLYEIHYDSLERENITRIISTFARYNPKHFGLPYGTWKRLGGGDALDTMRLLVRESFAASNTVVIASNAGYKDALSAAALAAKEQAPILLTSPHTLSAKTADEIGRLGATRAIVVGGPAAIKEAVLNQIRALGVESVDRIWGHNAAATSRAVANELPQADMVIVATSRDFADALSVAPFSYAYKVPIILTEYNRTLTQDAITTIKDLNASKVLIVGGTSAVPESVEKQLVENGLFVTRKWGTTALDTSLAIAEWELTQGFGLTSVGVTTRNNYKDALAGAALMGVNKGPIVLVNGDNPRVVISLLTGRAVQVQAGYFFGGTKAVSESAEDTIRSII